MEFEACTTLTVDGKRVTIPLYMKRDAEKLTHSDDDLERIHTNFLPADMSKALDLGRKASFGEGFRNGIPDRMYEDRGEWDKLALQRESNKYMQGGDFIP